MKQLHTDRQLLTTFTKKKALFSASDVFLRLLLNNFDQVLLRQMEGRLRRTRSRLMFHGVRGRLQVCARQQLGASRVPN